MKKTQKCNKILAKIKPSTHISVYTAQMLIIEPTPTISVQITLIQLNIQINTKIISPRSDHRTPTYRGAQT